jgi:hypothetical protein
VVIAEVNLIGLPALAHVGWRAFFLRSGREITLSKNGRFLKKLMLNRHIHCRGIVTTPKRISRLL